MIHQPPAFVAPANQTTTLTVVNAWRSPLPVTFSRPSCPVFSDAGLISTVIPPGRQASFIGSRPALCLGAESIVIVPPDRPKVDTCEMAVIYDKGVYFYLLFLKGQGTECSLAPTKGGHGYTLTYSHKGAP